jgi:gamma-glutamyltranspeptidase / glutathione hydrolase
MDVLRSGGNAVDAALAAGAVMNVCEPHTSHLGGDAFLLIYHGPTGVVHAINASGPAPQTARLESYLDGAIPVRGYRSSTVPGQLAGWGLARRLFGTWSWSDLLSPAIGIAEWGFPVERRLAEAITAHQALLAESPSAARLLLPDGVPLRLGDTLRQPELAHALRAVAVGGPEEFYRGGLGGLLDDAFAREGDLSARDLHDYAPTRPDPLSADWASRRVYVQPPASQAHVMLEALLIAAPVLAAADGPDDPRWLHAAIEATKLAFADRFAYAGEGCEAMVGRLLKPSYAAERRAAIDPSRALTPEPGVVGDGDTTQIATADSDGTAVCLIQSLFHAFGCGVMVEGGGFFMNNRLTGFELDPTHPNCLEPGKLPVHTLSTYLTVRDGALEMVGGCPGGMKQVQFNLQILANVLGFGNDPQRAVEYPRWAWEAGLEVSVEEGFGAALLGALGGLGHVVRPVPAGEGGGAAQVILRRPDGLYFAGSDPRADGRAEAF